MYCTEREDSVALDPPNRTSCNKGRKPAPPAWHQTFRSMVQISKASDDIISDPFHDETVLPASTPDRQRPSAVLSGDSVVHKDPCLSDVAPSPLDDATTGLSSVVPPPLQPIGSYPKDVNYIPDGDVQAIVPVPSDVIDPGDVHADVEGHIMTSKLSCHSIRSLSGIFLVPDRKIDEYPAYQDKLEIEFKVDGLRKTLDFTQRPMGFSFLVETAIFDHSGITVAAVIPGSIADNLGVKIGWELQMVGGTPVRGKNSLSCKQLLKEKSEHLPICTVDDTLAPGDLDEPSECSVQGEHFGEDEHVPEDEHLPFLPWACAGTALEGGGFGANLALEMAVNSRRRLVKESTSKIMSMLQIQVQQHSDMLQQLLLDEDACQQGFVMDILSKAMKEKQILPEVQKSGFDEQYSSKQIWLESPSEKLTVDDEFTVLKDKCGGMRTSLHTTNGDPEDANRTSPAPDENPKKDQEGSRVSTRNSKMHLWSSGKANDDPKAPLPLVEDETLTKRASVLSKGAHYVEAKVHALKKHADAWKKIHAKNDRADVHFVQRLVHSNYFNAVSMALIFINALLIGLQTDVDMEHIRDWTPGSHLTLGAEYRGAGIFFSLAFAVELSLRIAADRANFIFTPDINWNILDCVLVVSGLLEIVLQNSSNLTFARVIRMLRLTRILRVVRLVRFFENLRKMVFALLNSLLSLFWLALLLSLVLFIFAVGFMQGIQQFLQDEDDPTAAIDFGFFMRVYGSLPKTMLSLLETFSGGTGWFAVMGPVMSISWVYGVAAIFFVCFTIFGVMNVVTGIFVDRALYISQVDRSVVVREEMQKTQSCMEELKHEFRRMDSHGNGTLTREEARCSLDKPEVKGLLAALHVNVSEPGQLEQLCDLLDPEETNAIAIDDFIQACLRLRGVASSLDLCAVMLEVSSVRMRLEEVSEGLQERSDAVMRTCDHLVDRLAPRMGPLRASEVKSLKKNCQTSTLPKKRMKRLPLANPGVDALSGAVTALPKPLLRL